MGTPVILPPRAEEDLQGIVVFIARRNEERAQSFGNELINKALVLGDRPRLGRVIPKQPYPAVREILHGSYRIVHEVLNHLPRIFILRFWHAARGTPQIVED